jgi:hypothetical protein
MKRYLLHLQPLLLLLAGAAVFAAEPKPPDGIVVGRVVLQPYWASYLEHDDNVYRRCDPDKDPDCQIDYTIEPDYIHSLLFGLKGEIPVRTGRVDFGYLGDQRRYNQTGGNIGRSLSHDLNAGMTMRFGSGDRLTLSDEYTLGVVDLQVIDDVGGDVVRRGEPYNFNRWSVELAREAPRMQGYQIKVTRLDMTFDSKQCDETDANCWPVPFFDYRGFQSAFQYRHPLPVDNWLVGYYGFRRIDNYTPKNSTEEEDDYGPGVMYRTEHSSSYQIGIGGYMRQKHPFLVRAGYGRFAFTGLEPSLSPFKGLVGHARLMLNVGSRTEVNFSFDRRPLPSNYPTYYINNALRLQVDRKWLRNSKVGMKLNLSRNKYGDELDEGDSPFCAGRIRQDDRMMVDAHVEWMLHRLVGFRVAASHWRRHSNCESSDYDANVISAGIELGWN